MFKWFRKENEETENEETENVISARVLKMDLEKVLEDIRNQLPQKDIWDEYRISKENLSRLKQIYVQIKPKYEWDSILEKRLREIHETYLGKIPDTDHSNGLYDRIIVVYGEQFENHTHEIIGVEVTKGTKIIPLRDFINKKDMEYVQEGIDMKNYRRMTCDSFARQKEHHLEVSLKLIEAWTIDKQTWEDQNPMWNAIFKFSKGMCTREEKEHLPPRCKKVEFRGQFLDVIPELAEEAYEDLTKPKN